MNIERTGEHQIVIEMRSSKNAKLFTPNYVRRALTITRWIIIVAFFAFVVQGWVRSAKKYLSHKTSISTTVSETYTFRYPSITLCPGMKAHANLRRVFVDQLHHNQGVNVLTDELFTQTVEKLTYDRTDFITFFSHPKLGDPTRAENNIVRNDSLWKESIPDETLSGKCYTYDPTYESYPGKWYAIMFDIKFPDDLQSEDDKLGFLDRLKIFLHANDSFIFYTEDDMPSSYRIDNSLLELNKENSLSVKYSRMTSLDREEMPCAKNSSYSYLKCFELHWAQKRGCQKPWFHFDDFNIPICRNISGEIDTLLKNEYEWSQAHWSKLEKTSKTGCPVPCTDVIYDLDYSYARLSELDLKEADFRVYIWFKNFKFSNNEEYIVCDWTCLIGEIGGNFGFFLGGSILALYDFIYGAVNKKVLA